MARAHYVYLARCADGTFYCGYAVDPAKRVQTHNGGKGSKILRGKRPVHLAYTRRFRLKGDALRFEIVLKRRSHEEKRLLVRRFKDRKKARE